MAQPSKQLNMRAYQSLNVVYKTAKKNVHIYERFYLSDVVYDYFAGNVGTVIPAISNITRTT